MVEPTLTYGNQTTRKKLWALDDEGNTTSDRPFYHRFPIDGGWWVIARPKVGVWLARFYGD
jgi:hypothetical protein